MNQTELLKGTLGTIIMRLLQERGRMYGYEITQQVKILSEGKILVKEGSLYPALHKLEAEGYVTSATEYQGKRPRRYYQLTPAGSTAIVAAVEELLAFIKTIIQVISLENINKQNAVNPAEKIPAGTSSAANTAPNQEKAAANKENAKPINKFFWLTGK